MEKEEKRVTINAIDSFKCFLFSILAPLIASACFTVIITLLSGIFKIDYEVFIENWLVKGLMYILNSLAFLFVFIYYYKKNKIDFRKTINVERGYNPISIVIVMALSLILVFGSTNFIGLVDHVLALIGFKPDGNLPVKLNSVGNMLISIALWAILPAICEELLFRGVIFKGLLSKFKVIPAILLGGTMFMLMHGSLQQTTYQFILGVVLCAIYYSTNNLFYPMLLHFLNNTIVIILGYVEETTGFTINVAFSSAWSYIWPILLMIAVVAIVIALIYVLRKYNKSKYENDIPTEYPVMEKDATHVMNKWFLISFLTAIIIWIANTVYYWVQ